MRLNPNVLHGFHLAVEIVLAGLVWLLLRRLNAARNLARALETDLGLVKKRFEAATAGLHIRLLQVERQAKLAAGAAAGAGGARPVRPSAVVSLPRPAPDTTPMNRGEWDLMMKIRQLRGE